MRLRSVELTVADVDKAAGFFEKVWGLTRAGDGRLRGTAALPYIVDLKEGRPAIASITFSGTHDEIGKEREVKGPEGQRYRFVFDAPAEPLAPHPDKPIQLSHVVLNAADVDACERFAVSELGFKLTDRTAHMSFVRCNRTHHCLAFARGGRSSLNHIAFEMPALDSVMRGIGRLRDAGFDCVWGPGRHGPGNNVFGYFVAPFGAIIEYTSEVEEVGDDYRVGGPEDWKWPTGRIDHWGVSSRKSEAMAANELRWAG